MQIAELLKGYWIRNGSNVRMKHMKIELEFNFDLMRKENIEKIWFWCQMINLNGLNIIIHYSSDLILWYVLGAYLIFHLPKLKPS